MAKRSFLLLPVILLLVFVALVCSGGPVGQRSGSANHVGLELKVPPVFRFAALGDTRFHDPQDTVAANPAVRRALVSAVAKEQPSFVTIGGDIVYTGESVEDWHVWETETAAWREHKIPVYPVIGNHDIKGDLKKALGNYFAHFPELQESRFYSLRAGNCLLLFLDSSSDELAGAQGDWFRLQLDQIAPSVDYVFLIFHHPVHTSSSDAKTMGGGHSARTWEQGLGRYLEQRQTKLRTRLVVLNSHVHNYERHEHGGITYFVTGGGGAHAYPIPRLADDPYQDAGINYHYLLAEVDHGRLTVTMRKLEFKDGKELWTEPDAVTITTSAALPSAAD